MNNVVVALIWETWRLSRRWYSWVLAVAFAIDLGLMRQGSVFASSRPRGISDAVIMQVAVAPAVFMLNFTLALFATLLAMSVGSRAGFPLAFEYRLPVRTPLLVCVPLLTLASLCASLYMLPVLVCRVLFDVPFPILPVGMLLGTLVIILLACGWSARSSTSRSLALLGGLVLAAQLFSVLHPVNLTPPPLPPGQVPAFNHDIVALTPGQYVFLAAVCVLLYWLTLAAIRKQRCGDTAMSASPGSASAKPALKNVSISSLLLRAGDWVTLPCPMTSAWRAELWLELKRQVLPILMFSALLAAAIPLFLLLDFMPSRSDAAWVDYLFPALAFFAGIGIAVFNRRQGTAGYMSAFEGTRSMSTLQLASIQVLSVTAGTLLGVVIVCISLYFSSVLSGEQGQLALRLQGLLTSAGNVHPLFIVADAVTQLVIYLSAVMLLFCVHTWSVIWGRWVPYGAGVVGIYAMIFAAKVQASTATLDDIKQRMWAFAIVIVVATLLAFGRTLYLKVLSLRASLIALLCWGLFLICSVYSLTQQDIVLTRQASELQAFNVALLTLPLLLFVLLLWSYDRLRHR
jgi:hypothetical protein